MLNGYLERIAGRYQTQGYEIYGLPPDHPDLPLNWIGPFPDLVVRNQDECTAFFAPIPHPCQAIRTGRRFDASSEAQNVKKREGSPFKSLRTRVRAAMGNPGVHVCLFCSSPDCPQRENASTCFFSQKIFRCVEIHRLSEDAHLQPSGSASRNGRYASATAT